MGGLVGRRGLRRRFGAKGHQLGRRRRDPWEGRHRYLIVCSLPLATTHLAAQGTFCQWHSDPCGGPTHRQAGPLPTHPQMDARVTASKRPH